MYGALTQPIGVEPHRQNLLRTLGEFSSDLTVAKWPIISSPF